MRAFVLLATLFAASAPLAAQDAKSIEALDAKIRDLEARLKKLDLREQSWTNKLFEEERERREDNHHIMFWTIVGFLFVSAFFCALWAQNTGRSAILWFAVGFFTHVIALSVLLYKNSKDIAAKRSSSLGVDR